MVAAVAGPQNGIKTDCGVRKLHPLIPNQCFALFWWWYNISCNYRTQGLHPDEGALNSLYQ